MVTSWIMPWGQMAWLRQLDDALARRVFDTPSSFVVGGPVPGYGCTPVRLYTSLETYIAASAAYNGWVCYDLENWGASPAPEKQHPELAMRDFMLTARARGHGVIAAPSRDLVYAAGADSGIRANEDINAAYLRCGIPGTTTGAAVCLVQSQGAQKDLVAFTGLLEGAADQQVMGSNQALWAGLTTAFSTAAQMKAAHDAAAASVSGFWVTIGTQAQAPVAADFFRQVLA